MRSSGPNRVRIRLAFDPDGALRLVEAEGHAGTKAVGSNLACAAISVLLRGAYETIAGFPGVAVTGEAPGPGNLRFEIRRSTSESAERLRGVADFLRVGLSGVDRDYPGLIELCIES